MEAREGEKNLRDNNNIGARACVSLPELHSLTSLLFFFFRLVELQSACFECGKVFFYWNEKNFPHSISRSCEWGIFRVSPRAQSNRVERFFFYFHIRCGFVGVNSFRTKNKTPHWTPLPDCVVEILQKFHCCHLRTHEVDADDDGRVNKCTEKLKHNFDLLYIFHTTTLIDFNDEFIFFKRWVGKSHKYFIVSLSRRSRLVGWVKLFFFFNNNFFLFVPTPRLPELEPYVLRTFSHSAAALTLTEGEKKNTFWVDSSRRWMSQQVGDFSHSAASEFSRRNFAFNRSFFFSSTTTRSIDTSSKTKNVEKLDKIMAKKSLKKKSDEEKWKLIAHDSN